MNIVKTFVLFFFITSVIYSQNITNTLGTNGVFYIKDATNNYFTLTQSTGQVNILNSLRLEVTGSSATTGVIFKGTNRFIHDFVPSGAPGYNTFIGINSGNFTMSYAAGSEASYNTGVGYCSLTSLTSGYDNTASGSNSLYFNTTGSSNTASGFYALYSNTTGIENTASGSASLYSNSTGYYNTASGFYALYSNTSGFDNTASGFYSLQYNTTGHDNTASGSNSLYSNTTGIENTASGSSSLNSNSTGNYNTASGYNSLQYNTTGYHNTASGFYSLQYNATGNNNTASGYYAGNSITSGSNLTCIGYNAQPTSATATNEITLGDANVTSLRCAVQSITSLSDARDKKNIHDLNLGIDFLMKIKPRIFNWDKREWYKNNKSDGSKMQKTPTAGFIAQELDKVQTEEHADWLHLVLKDNPQKFEATPGNLLPIIVKAIQDLKKENDELKAKNKFFQAANDKLKDRLTKFEQTQNMLVAEIEKLKTNNNQTTKASLGEK